MKEFAFIFRTNDDTGAKHTHELLQERIAWLASVAARDNLVNKGKALSA